MCYERKNPPKYHKTHQGKKLHANRPVTLSPRARATGPFGGNRVTTGDSVWSPRAPPHSPSAAGSGPRGPAQASLAPGASGALPGGLFGAASPGTLHTPARAAGAALAEEPPSGAPAEGEAAAGSSPSSRGLCGPAAAARLFLHGSIFSESDIPGRTWKTGKRLAAALRHRELGPAGPARSLPGKRKRRRARPPRRRRRHVGRG